MKAKKWVMVKQFVGFPKDSDIELQEEELAPLQDGEFLCEAEWLSVDPYMRPYMSAFPEGSIMMGQQVAKVTESKCADFPVGTRVLGRFGWRSHTVQDEKKAKQTFSGHHVVTKLPEYPGISPSLFLGALGMPGGTAHMGFLKLCEPKAGETVLVNGAAGAVGSLVGQIAKIKGCTVIGYAGSDAKVECLKKEFGFDHAFNYKTCDLSETLSKVAPEGVDCYFDNVGGQFSSTVVKQHMKLFGRISICGVISQYNATEDTTGSLPWRDILSKQLRIEGFIVTRWSPDEWAKTLKEMGEWIAAGKIHCKEHVTEGFEKMRDAFFGMLKGENTGKAVVKASPGTHL